VLVPMLAIDNLVNTLNQLYVQPAIIERVEKNLKDAVNSLNSVQFKAEGTIGQLSFGDNSTASSLSTHHAMAHAVMTDTLNGIVEEINSYTENLQRSVELLRTTDEDSAASLQSQEALVQSLSWLTDHSQGDQANQQSRADGADPYPHEGDS
jgi:alcohol dehydrogenase class IV